MNPLLILGLVIGAAYFFKSQAASNLRVTVNGLSISGGKLVLNVQLLNPSNASINLNSFVGDLYQGSNSVAKLTFFGPVSIASNNATNIPVLVSLNTLGLAAQIMQYITGGFKLTGLTCVATINAEGVSFNKTFNL